MMKRAFDFLISASLLILLAPVMALLAIIVAVQMGRPIVFCQERPGLHGRPFTMIKFRTMRNIVDRKGAPLSDAERLTGFGRFLRASSLDELPELFNVLKGDMSLVGPRPLLMEYLPLYSPEQARRHEVRPGITGWAQVNGRNALSWEQKFKYDIDYIDNRSLVLDVKILIRTLVVIVMARGINGNETMIMVPFEGRREVQKSGKK
jgi:lipopolysaccharide/colanic/teichoic acid biosynthesis glycosyltransferase